MLPKESLNKNLFPGLLKYLQDENDSEAGGEGMAAYSSDGLCTTTVHI